MPPQPYPGGQLPQMPLQAYPGGQPPQPKRSHKGRWIALILGVVLLLGIVGIVAAASGAGNSTNTGKKTIATAKTAPTAPHFMVGDQVKVGNTWIVTINSAKSSAGDQFSTPAAGNTYLVVDITLKNASAQEQDVSSLAQFTLKDATGQKYTETITDFTTPPDGKVAAGDLLRGQFAFEVPASMHQFTFAFEADPFQPGQTICDLTI